MRVDFELRERASKISLLCILQEAMINIIWELPKRSIRGWQSLKRVQREIEGTKPRRMVLTGKALFVMRDPVNLRCRTSRARQ